MSTEAGLPPTDGDERIRELACTAWNIPVIQQTIFDNLLGRYKHKNRHPFAHPRQVKLSIRCKKLVPAYHVR